MAVTMGITGPGISATTSAENAKAADILKRAATELGYNVGSMTNQQIAQAIVDEWKNHIIHLARRNRKNELVPPVEQGVDTDTGLQWS